MLFVNWFRLVYAAVCCKASGGFVCLGRAGAELQSFNTWLSLVALADDTPPIVVVKCGPNCSDGQCASLLKRFPRLTRIWFDGQAVTGDLPWRDLQVKGLESVMFWDTHLESLFIENTAVTDESILAIESLTSLEALAIGGSLITADAVESLLQRRPRLDIARDLL